MSIYCLQPAILFNYAAAAAAAADDDDNKNKNNNNNTATTTTDNDNRIEMRNPIFFFYNHERHKLSLTR